MGLMLWSPPELAGFGVGEGKGSLGTGVELRLTDQGLIESTAEAQVDLSVFLSPGTVAMLSSVRYCHAREAPRENLLLVETRSSCLTTTRLKVATSGLLGDANVEDAEGRRRSYFCSAVGRKRGKSRHRCNKQGGSQGSGAVGRVDRKESMNLHQVHKSGLSQKANGNKHGRERV